MIRRVVPLCLLVSMSLAACGTTASNVILCDGGEDTLILTAQAVPSATMVPCITAFAAGWTYGGFLAESGMVRYWMDSDRAGIHAIEVQLTERCDASGAVEVDTGPEVSGVRRFEQPISLEPRLSGLRFFTFTGGCVTFRYDIAEGAPSTLLLEADLGMTLIPRSTLAAALAESRDLILCGAGAPPCEGETGS